MGLLTGKGSPLGNLYFQRPSGKQEE